MTFQVRCFNAGDGDCLLLSATEDQTGESDGDGENGGGAEDAGRPTHILVDGGRTTPFKQNAASYLYNNDEVETLDLVVVSHIDNDHISGILRLLKDKVKHTVWKVRSERGRAPGLSRKEPKRPPEIAKLWHNSVSDTLGKEIDQTVAQQSLATSAALLGGQLAGLARHESSEAAAKLDNLATGHRSAIELEGRIGGKLGIETEDELILVPAGDRARRSRRRVGAFSIVVLGPTEERIEALRKDWQKWIAENEEARLKVMEQLRHDEEEMGAITPDTVSPDSLAQGSSGGTITVPNLASLMLLVRAGGKRVLLTGDGSSEDIVEGLDRCGIDDRHFDVLKVQHHGATANVTEEFCHQITADTYLFCGNGAHSNPELDVLRRIATARLTGAGPDRPFTFAFTSKSTTKRLSARRVAHMTKVETAVKVLEQFVEEQAANPSTESEEDRAAAFEAFVADPSRHQSRRSRRLKNEFLPSTKTHLTFDL